RCVRARGLAVGYTDRRAEADTRGRLAGPRERIAAEDRGDWIRRGYRTWVVGHARHLRADAQGEQKGAVPPRLAGGLHEPPAAPRMRTGCGIGSRGLREGSVRVWQITSGPAASQEAPSAFQNAGDRLRIRLAVAIAQRRQRAGLPLPVQDRPDDRLASPAG